MKTAIQKNRIELYLGKKTAYVGTDREKIHV